MVGLRNERPDPVPKRPPRHRCIAPVQSSFYCYSVSPQEAKPQPIEDPRPWSSTARECTVHISVQEIEKFQNHPKVLKTFNLEWVDVAQSGALDVQDCRSTNASRTSIPRTKA